MALDGMAGGKYGRADFSRGESASSMRAFDLSDRFRMPSVPFVKLEGYFEGTRFLLVKPATFMNESGKALASLRTRGMVKDPSELLVVVDDVDLDLGSLRFREKGSAGGHNGLKSIIGALGTTEFARIRIGVGPRPSGSDMVDYVLGTFRPDEWEFLDKVLNIAVLGVEAWLIGGAEGARREISKAPHFSNPIS